MGQPKNMARAFAPGKCILFGEHAVVFGHPAVAVAVDQGVTVSLRESDEWKLGGSYFDPSQHPHIAHIIQNVYSYSGKPLDIEVESDLFSAAGMGSSAALSNAFGAAMHMQIYPGEDLDPINAESGDEDDLDPSQLLAVQQNDLRSSDFITQFRSHMHHNRMKAL